MKRAVDYDRVSTFEQATEGYSIASQSESNKKFIESQNWELIDRYVDDGYSAKNLNRPEMQRLIEDAQAKKFDVVVFYKLDRLVRSVSDLDKLLKIFDANNIAIRSVTEPFDTTTAMGRFLIILVAAIAQWERETISERVSLNILQKTKSGEWKGGTPPFGYKIVNEKLVVNDDESPVVKEVFQLARTLGFYTIAKTLTSKGFVTRNGGDWHVDTVRGIANNPIYAGYLTNNTSRKEYKKPPREQTLYEGNHPRLISREEFWELQDILDKRRSFGGKRETSNYYFSSILKCGRCGYSMSGHKSNGYKTYRCSGKKAGISCTSHIIKEDNLVSKVLDSLDELIEKANLDSDINNVSKQKMEEIEKELKSVKKLLKKKKAMYENDIIDIDELILETEALRKKEVELTKELKQYTSSQKLNNEDISYIIENIHDLWQHINDHDRKQMMSTLFNTIVVDTKDEYKRSVSTHREIIIVSAK
ncbi:recombinase family protein [Niallia sp. FSL W8-0954]|uniref:recombinase family protein n=1 Tax=Niallia sp. FSL W8-0954 TaxID=2975338 RepID=UPI0030F97C5F